VQKVRLMALGGLDETGKNMYLVEVDEDIFVIEAGLKFPVEADNLGVEYIIPDFSYLVQNKERVKAIFITHAHTDVVLPLIHLLKEIDIPIYASALTAKYIEDVFTKFQIKKYINVIKRKDNFKIDKHYIHTFPVMQSVPDAFGLVIDTDLGSVVYAGEFIFDCDTNNRNFQMDVDTIANIGNKGVLALLSESCGASRSGYTAPKHRISNFLDHQFDSISCRIIITLYKQNLFRIIEVLEQAKLHNKKVYFYDSEHIKFLKHLEDLNYYKIPRDVIIDQKDFDNSFDDVVVVISGFGGNVFKLMNKIAINEDHIIELRETDTVIVASPVAQGTEKYASSMENDLFKANVNVVKVSPKEVLSMHASIEDLKMMLYFVKPHYYIPINGEYASLVDNADVAVSVGYTPDRIVILDNGQFATFDDGKLISTRDIVDLKDVSIDASSKIDVSSMVLKDREALSTDGVIVVGVVLDFDTKKVIGGPDVQSRGVIYLKDADHILQEIASIMINKIESMVEEGIYSNMQARIESREDMSYFIARETGKHPVILPAIVEIKTK